MAPLQTARESLISQQLLSGLWRSIARIMSTLAAAFASRVPHRGADKATTCAPAPRARLSRAPWWCYLPRVLLGTPVTLALGVRQAIPCSVTAKRAENDVGSPFIPLNAFVGHRPSRRCTMSKSRTHGSRWPRMRPATDQDAVHPWRLGFKQCSLSRSLRRWRTTAYTSSAVPRFTNTPSSARPSGLGELFASEAIHP